MEPTRDVVLDLLPLYLAGEASPDSQALVKDHLESDPDLARLAERWPERLTDSPPQPVNPDSQALAFSEAKRQIANRIITVAAVVALTTLAIAATALIGAMFFLRM